MIIAGLQKTTLIDYPGKIAATVFLAGCNFRCDWCYSSELVLPEKIKNQPRISEKDFFGFLEQRKGLLDGIVICGGEPTINKDLPDFIRKIKKLNYLVKLDTNGSNPKMLKQLIDGKLIDYVAMDVKLPKEKYSRVFFDNTDIGDIEKSVELLKNSEIDFEFRTTIVPTVHKKEDFLKIAEWIGCPKIKYYIQNFRAEKTINPEFENIEPYPENYLLDIKKSISRYFDICGIR